MANQITYTDKVDLNETSVADINKVKASDLNEIKSVVNEMSTEHNTLSSTVQTMQTNLQFIRGTVIKQASGDAQSLFTLTELRNLFNVPTATNVNFFAIVNNGDGNANNRHFENCTWVGNTLYVVWNGTLSATTSTRINYVIFYLP